MKEKSAAAAATAAKMGQVKERGRGKGGGGGGGGDVRLTQCPRCKRFADKYVEHDFVVLFIDLVLVKPQVSFYFVFVDFDLIFFCPNFGGFFSEILYALISGILPFFGE